MIDPVNIYTQGTLEEYDYTICKDYIYVTDNDGSTSKPEKMAITPALVVKLYREMVKHDLDLEGLAILATTTYDDEYKVLIE